MQTIVVTRHVGLVEYLREIGLIEPDAQVIAHAAPDDVRGRHVIGILPLSLAALAASVTEIPMALPPELRGVELTLEQVRQYAGAPARYEVRRISLPNQGAPTVRTRAIVEAELAMVEAEIAAATQWGAALAAADEWRTDLQRELRRIS